ncbi:MAG: phospholipid carrier-dependent glycosyltransferase [Cyclobacteriaceae bacterium]
MKLSSNKFLFPLLLVIVFIATYTYTFDPKIAQLGDNASYYILGKSISLGEGYLNISKITKTPNNHYPPGYPAILAIVMVFTSNVTVLKILNGIFLLGTVLILYRLVTLLSHSRLLAFACGLILLGNFHMQQYGSILMSEIPFAFFSMLALLFIVKWKQKGGGLGAEFWAALGCAIASYYIRSLGIALFGGIVFYMLTEKRWKAAGIFIVGFVMAALPWFIRGQQLGGGSYLKQLSLINPYRPEMGQAEFSDFVNRFFENLSRYISTEIPYALFAGEMPDYGNGAEISDWLVGLAIIALTVFGIIKFSEYKWLILAYLLATFGILMFWPDVWVGVRFMVPVIPLLIMGFLHGIYQGITFVFRQAQRGFSPAWLLILFFFMAAPLAALHDQAKQPLHPAWQNYYAMAEWLKANESREVVVSCGKPSLFYLYSGTYTMRYAFEEDPNKLIADLEDGKVDYVVLDQVYGNTIRYLLPAIKAYPDRFEQVYYRQNPDTFLLRFKR